MYILGIESSCDETAAAVVDADGKVLSNVVSSQIPVHARYGGVIPELASRNHLMAIDTMVQEALKQAGLPLERITRVGVTLGPGLIGSLMVGVQYAKSLAWTRGLELVPVHHVEGHITAVLIQDGADHPHGPLEFPYLALAVSGGHTSIYLVSAPGQYALLGYTLDDAAGEAFDKVARILGLPYPGGVHVDRISREGNGRVDAVAFPRPLKGRDDFVFSFSGLKTAARVFLQGWNPEAPDNTLTLADVAASFQEAVVDTLLRTTFAAAQAHRARHVVIAGGVAANSRLRGKLTATAPDYGLCAHVTKFAYCTDNAAMIANLARFKTPVTGADMLQLEPFASGQLAPTLAA